MPWLETAPMEQRERFVRDHQLALYTMAELSATALVGKRATSGWTDSIRAGVVGSAITAGRRCGVRTRYLTRWRR
jgi:hypothetical protein